MTRRTASRLAWSVFAAGIVVFGARVWLSLLADDAEVLPFLPVMLAFGGIGAVVASNQPGNALGWLMLSIAPIMSLGLLADGYASYGLTQIPQAPGTVWAAWAFTVSIEVGLAPLLFVLLLFPRGDLLSPRWRPVAWACAIVPAVGAVCTAVADVNFSRPGNVPTLEHPLTLFPTAAVEPIYWLYQATSLALLLLAAASLVLRFRRSKGEERQQLKWIAYAAAVAALGFALIAFLAPLGLEPVLAFILFVPLIPIAVGLAVLKYRLYDIDIVISKTVVFGALAAFITGVYALVVVGLGSMLLDTDSVGLSIAATAVVAVLFQPVRERVQRFANRLVYGKRATPSEVMAGFSRRVSETLSVDRVLPQMAEAAARGVGAQAASIRVFLPGGREHVETWRSDDVPREGEPFRIDVKHQGDSIGEIAVVKPTGEALSDGEKALLTDLASQAGLALHNVRLTEELEIRLNELAEQSEQLRISRQRLVTARDVQRRGLERDIREGPGHQLLGIRHKLDEADALAASDPDTAGTVLDHLGEQATATLEGLRDLARGIFPPLLAEKGIVTALQAHIRKVGANAGVEAGVDVRGTRFDADTEACVYFCCLQSIQNVMRHADNAPCTVRLFHEHDALTFSVEDAGPGFDPATTEPGMGLQITRDRVDALEGELTISSAPRRGVTVRIRIPARALEEVG